jgi:sugar/nucleoside kinase (ribokinase family)
MSEHAVPDFVVVGHAARDLTADGWRMGGTITFAAAQAHRLGRSVGVVTRAGPELDVARELPFADVRARRSPQSTTFENIYTPAGRRQRILAVADAIAPADVPVAWRAAPVVLLGPLWGELPPDFAAVFAEESLVGVSAQGWLRAADDEGNVLHAPWTGEPFWRGADVLFVSDEDLGDGGEQLGRWLADVPVVAMTESWRGARVCTGGRWRRMDAFPEDEVDPTGAGDTFATAFLIRLHETGDVDEAARFGAAAASISVGGVGVAAVPDRAAIEQRMRQYPEVALR